MTPEVREPGKGINIFIDDEPPITGARIKVIGVGGCGGNAIDHMIEVQFNLVERGNTMVTFPQPRDRAIIGDLAREPGVLAVEGQRIVPVRLRGVIAAT